VDFVRKGFLGVLADFKNRFEAPITNGQHVDSTEEDVKLMKHRAHVLHSILQGFVQRVGVEALRAQLPPKYETVICIRLSQLQRRLYQHFIDTFKPQLKSNPLPSPEAPQTNGGGLFNAHSKLLKVWNHPDLLPLGDGKLLDTESNQAGKTIYRVSCAGGTSIPLDFGKENALPHAASGPTGDLASSSNPLATNNNPDGPAQPAGSSGEAMNNGFGTLHPSGSGVNSDLEKQNSGRFSSGNSEALEAEAGQNVSWYEQAGVPKWWMDSDHEAIVQRSGKLAVALSIFKQAACRKEKTLMFSQSLDTLKLLESVLKKVHFTEGKEYLRIDGEIQARNRQQRVEAFNSSSKDSPMLMIISIRAGSLGINLVGASRVVLLDMLWNPSHELQAVFRAYRYGQNRPVHVYRLLSAGTMEEKIYWRQITKQGLAARIVDEHQVARTFKASELENIYTLEPDDYWETYGAESQQHIPPAVGQSTQSPRQTPQGFGYANGTEDAPIDVDDPTNTSPTATADANNQEFNKHKDPILSSLMCDKLSQWILKCFEHDTLLQDIEEEQLDKQERKSAWKAYEDAVRSPVNTKVPGSAGVPGADKPPMGSTSVATLSSVQRGAPSGFQQAKVHKGRNTSSVGATGQMLDMKQQLAQLYRQDNSVGSSGGVCPGTSDLTNAGTPTGIPDDVHVGERPKQPAQSVNQGNTAQVEPNSGSSTIKCLGDLNLDSNSIPDTIPDGELGNVKAAVHESEAANDSGLKELPCNVMKGLRVRSLLKGEGEIQKVYDKGGDYIYGLVFDGTKEEERLSNHDLIAREIVFLSSHAPDQVQQVPVTPDVAVQPAWAVQAENCAACVDEMSVECHLVNTALANSSL